jgi:hypothetical protein
MADAAKPFDRATLQAAFERLGEMAKAAGRVVEISVYGGSALVLTMDFRAGTRDVDAVFENDRPFLRRASQIVAEEFGWEPTWLNDGVKGFLSAGDDSAGAKALFHTYPDETGPGLRVLVATPTYLFAMKCLAMRAGGAEETGDLDDIRRLGAELDVVTAQDAFAVISRYYPLEKLSPKTQFGLEEIFGGSKAG